MKTDSLIMLFLSLMSLLIGIVGYYIIKITELNVERFDATHGSSVILMAFGLGFFFLMLGFYELSKG